MISCPVGRTPRPDVAQVAAATGICPTQLQPYRGRLTDGVAQHLMVVHELEGDTATAVAVAWVQRGGRAPR